MPLVLRLAHGTMAALFAISTLLQFNDRSPLAWIVIYTLAAGATFLTAVRKWPCAQILGGIVLAVSLIAELRYIRMQAWQIPVSDLIKGWSLTSETIDTGREFYGLLWIIIWMLVVIFSSRHALRQETGSPSSPAERGTFDPPPHS